jgi:hypothetical protein
MRKAAILMASGLALTAATAACTRGGRDEGPTVQRAFQVGSFQSVSLGGSQNVIVTVGGTAPSVRAEGSERALERLEIVVENGALQIRSRNSHSWFGRHSGGVTVHVTVPALAAASVGGSGEIRIDRVAGERFAASVGGSGEIEIGDLRVREATFDLAGSGDIRAAGAVERANINVAGSGDINLGALEIRDAQIALVGSGAVVAKATGTARVSLTGSGDVSVTGPARCQVEKFGSGDVHCGTSPA